MDCRARWSSASGGDRFAQLCVVFTVMAALCGLAAPAAAEDDGVSVTLDGSGLNVRNESGYFVAPYVVNEGDSYRSIADALFSNPEAASVLAQANQTPVDAPLTPGEPIMIPVSNFSLRFHPTDRESQAVKAARFLARAGPGTLFDLSWTLVDSSISIVDGVTRYLTLIATDVTIKSLRDVSLNLALSFEKCQMLEIFQGTTLIESMKASFDASPGP